MSSDDNEECFYDYDEEEEGQDEEEDAAMLVEEEPALPERPVDFWAITKEYLPAAQQQDLSMVMNLMYIKQHQAHALLIHHRWNVESILDYLDRKGPEHMLREAGIVIQQEKKSSSSRSSTAMASPMRLTCYVCFEDVSSLAVSTMHCGHCFCNDCWTEHFFTSVNGGQKQIRCMEVKCPSICDEAVVQRLLAAKYPGAARRLDHFLLQSYVDDNGAARWCPSAPHCGRAIRVADGGGDRCCEDVSCPCGVAFCFGCGASPPHSPCPCAMWERWDAKCRGESKNLDWILANTKNCPKCFKPIQKNGGCNHVRCKCGQCLCWLCGAATGMAHSMERIEGHSCNRFINTGEKRKADDAKRKVLRYTHYYERFKAHGDSRRTELEKLGPAVGARVRGLEQAGLRAPPARDAAESLADAHRALLASRLVLSRSYAFAYHMFGGDEERIMRATAATARARLETAQALFEDHQAMAEKHVEKLSGLLAAATATADAAVVAAEEDGMWWRTKQEAVNLTAVVRRHCGEMHKCIQDELLPMLVEPMSIASYRPDGPIKAKEYFPPASGV